MTQFVAWLALAASMGLWAWLGLGMRRQRRFLRRAARRHLRVSVEDHLRLQRSAYELNARRDAQRRGGTSTSLPIEFRSEWGEDVVLYELFDGAASGTIVEAGALDGRTHSVSYALEAIGWKAVLIEPVPAQAERCRSHRPHASVIHAALGPSGSSGDTTFLVPEDERFLPSAHRVHEGMERGHLGALAQNRAEMREVRVPLMSMDGALSRAGVASVDAAVIDVEGAELGVLEGFDLDRWRVGVLVIEDNSLGKSEAVAAHVRARGYEQAMWVGANRVFVRRERADLVARARRVAEIVYSPFVPPEGVPEWDPRLAR